jgi:hypothetical protein
MRYRSPDSSNLVSMSTAICIATGGGGGEKKKKKKENRERMAKKRISIQKDNLILCNVHVHHVQAIIISSHLFVCRCADDAP